jgi:hypothetical protein
MTLRSAYVWYILLSPVPVIFGVMVIYLALVVVFLVPALLSHKWPEYWSFATSARSWSGGFLMAPILWIGVLIQRLSRWSRVDKKLLAQTLKTSSIVQWILPWQADEIVRTHRSPTPKA